MIYYRHTIDQRNGFAIVTIDFSEGVEATALVAAHLLAARMIALRCGFDCELTWPSPECYNQRLVRVEIRYAGYWEEPWMRRMIGRQLCSVAREARRLGVREAA